MIHPLRKLAREIHRRSVWQVFGLYVLFSWAIHRLVVTATEAAGLPTWTPGMALSLLAIGLPVVLATAVVQGGLPGLRIVDVADPNELPGLTPDEVHVIPAPPYVLRFFTWRNATLGGVMAGTLLVGSVAAYLTMWGLGIGPVGSLLALGLVSEGDVVVVADFEGHVDDVALASAVRGALHADLSRSAVVTVLDAARVSEAMVRMGNAPETALPSGLALRLASREDIPVIIDGGVLRISDGYRVYARILSADGTALARFDEVVADVEGLEEKGTVLSARLREKLGESLRSIRAGT